MRPEDPKTSSSHRFLGCVGAACHVDRRPGRADVSHQFAFDNGTPSPGLYMLVPTGGTALIIVFATPDTWVGKVLGNKLLVGIGLISYSAYLWHQPVLALLRIGSLDEPSTAQLVLSMTTTFVLDLLALLAVHDRRVPCHG